MRIKWPNVFILALAIAALAFVGRFREAVDRVLDGWTRGFPTPEDRFIALASLGLICITVVACVRLICTNHKGDHQ